MAAGSFGSLSFSQATVKINRNADKDVRKWAGERTRVSAFLMERKTIGLALSGGGARGFAHVGVLKSLTSHGIPVDCVAGTSAGAFVGGAFAAGMSIDDVVLIGKGFSWMTVAGIPYSTRGLFSNAKMARFIRRHFPVTRFEELKLPFAAVATNLETGDEVIMREGDLPTAIRASCAIPGVFTPVADAAGRLLIDGGVVAPMPMNAIRMFDPDVVIAVDLMACGADFWGRPRTLVGTLFQSAMMLLRSASHMQHYAADVIIEPQIAHIRPDQMNKATELLELGFAAAEEKIDEIKALVGSVG